MQKAIDETERRRVVQQAYNVEHNITPETIKKAISVTLTEEAQAREVARQAIHATENEYDRVELITELEREMLRAAEDLEFERAARLRDEIAELKTADS